MSVLRYRFSMLLMLMSLDMGGLSEFGGPSLGNYFEILLFMVPNGVSSMSGAQILRKCEIRFCSIGSAQVNAIAGVPGNMAPCVAVCTLLGLVRCLATTRLRPGEPYDEHAEGRGGFMPKSCGSQPLVSGSTLCLGGHPPLPKS